jgi:hypothetical protein
MPNSGKTNVLLITTDQHRADCLGADPHCPSDDHGRPLVHTPNINNFVSVLRAVVASPVSAH